MDEPVPTTVWVFNGDGGAGFPSGVFASRASAEAWIRQNKLTGVLTEYPLGVGVYDWAVQRNLFVPKRPEHSSPKFIGGFSSAHQSHALHLVDSTI